MKILYDSHLIEKDIGYAYRFINYQRMTLEEHTHNYYEYFFIISGSVIHKINGKSERLKEGDLVFVRADDCHCYEKIPNHSCDIVNVAFEPEELEAYLSVYGEYLRDKLLRPKYSPKITLGGTRKNNFIKEYEYLNFFSSDKEAFIVRMKILLGETIGYFLKDYDGETLSDEDAHWNEVMRQMTMPANVEEGVPALIRLTGFSHGHLCRVMKKRNGITPVQYITDLRMVYASNLLRNSELKILDISLMVGYEGLSYFVSTFRKYFGVSPSVYRKQNLKGQI